MSYLVLATFYQKPERVLDPRPITVYGVGEGWRRTEEMGGRRRWILQLVEIDGAWEIPLGTARVVFPNSIFSEG